INAMLEESLMELNFGRPTLLERLEGYGDILLSGYTMYPGEVIIVISNSGINPVPIDIAMRAKQKGLFVVALTNKKHSESVYTRHSNGKRLLDIADEVLDNCCDYGDTTLTD